MQRMFAASVIRVGLGSVAELELYASWRQRMHDTRDALLAAGCSIATWLIAPGAAIVSRGISRRIKALGKGLGENLRSPGMAPLGTVHN